MEQVICIVCAENKNEIGPHVFQLLSKAKKLSMENGGRVIAVFAGLEPTSLIEVLAQYGAHEVIICSSQSNTREAFIEALEECLTVIQPSLVMIPASDWGRCCAAELSVSLQAGLTAECIDIQVQDSQYIFSRAAINRTIIANIKCTNTKIQICTIKKNAFASEAFERLENMKMTEWKREKTPWTRKCPQILQSIPIEMTAKLLLLDRAKIVFGFGRGIGTEANRDFLFKVAAKYGAEVAGTRGVVEAGWIEKERQVGQSGINIAPNIYVAFGISGATQHIVGIKNVRNVIAVNNDTNAPIFSYSNYIVIDDCMSVLRHMDKLSE